MGARSAARGGVRGHRGRLRRRSGPGINIEDGTEEALVSPRAHAAKVAEFERAAPDVFVNARIDTYWLGQDATVAVTLQRADAYVAAGVRDGDDAPSATPHPELQARLVDYSGT